jgi:S-adenosylmethionine:tRNA ribosyltransferase-isomerase
MSRIIDNMNNKTDLLLSSYNYDLPKELIAQEPLEKRDEAKLLVLDRKNGRIEHRVFKDIVEYLKPGDCVIVNKTKVIPARIYGKRETGGKIEVLFLSFEEGLPLERKVRALAKPFIEPGKKIIFPDNLEAIVEGKNNLGELILKLSGPSLRSVLDSYGQMPLPPYIKREKLNNGSLKNIDSENYQTVYSKIDGSIASPTAGLHFTKPLLDEIKKKGIEVIEITLHVGWGTFKPVKLENIVEHEMLPEYFSLSDENISSIKNIRKNKGRVFAVGTTSVRTLESAFKTEKIENSGQTSIFIYPGHEFKAIDALITNFHLPHSTPLFLTSAFAGREMILGAYNEAVKNKYRFYSYGDAMLIV